MGRARTDRGADAHDRRAAIVDDLVRAGRGDEDAFARFYDAAAGIVYGCVLRVIRNPAIAGEVTQEVFVELWRLAPRYDASRGSPLGWAATVAHRRAVDRVRAEESARVRDDRDARLPSPQHDSVADTVVDDIVATRDRDRVVAALDQLTSVQRESVTLAYYGGHTYREVAALLDVPEGTVKTRIRDGLIKLRDLLEVST